MAQLLGWEDSLHIGKSMHTARIGVTFTYTSKQISLRSTGKKDMGLLFFRNYVVLGQLKYLSFCVHTVIGHQLRNFRICMKKNAIYFCRHFFVFVCTYNGTDWPDFREHVA